MPRPRILFLNRSYWPDAEATGQLLTELCEDLAEQFDVTVVAGQPNWNAEGASFQRRGVQCRAGVTIRRVRHTRFAKRSVAGRVVNQLTFFAAATFAALAVKRPDIVVVETDPPFLALLGALARRRFGCRLVAYLQDIYPEVAVALRKLPRGFPTNVLHRLLHGVYRRADRVIVLSQDMRATLQRSGVADQRIAVLPNWADAGRIRPVAPAENRFRQQQQLNGQFVVMYSGNMGLSQRLEQVLRAADGLRSRRDMVFVLVGGGAARPALERQAAELRLPNVRFVDYQPQSELPHSLSAADLHLLPVDPRVVPYLMPSKLYGILAAGAPVLAVAPQDCELARIIQREGVGFVVPPGDTAALTERIASCADHREQLASMSRSARRLAVERYDRRGATTRIAQLLADLAPRGEGAKKSKSERVQK
ncbi:MAG TPA: glycosyltransferase family 4 protein [Candidatus Anammoximicrobium sp.]|nr:glycosyltransferase family 4 protein [Candidatus Anammoximicrobium sp.]